jgi:serine protease Do
MSHLIRGIAAGATIALIATSAWTPGSHADAHRGPGAWLGVKVVALNPGWREQYSYSGAGVRVTEVEAQSPADHIGIVRGDILVAVGNTSLKTEADLATARVRMDPSQATPVIIARHDGSLIKIRNLDAVAPASSGDVEPDESVTPLATAADAQDPLATLGIQCAPVNHDLATALGVTKDEGLLVLQVTAGGCADRVGIRCGDVISAAGDKRVATVEALGSALRPKPAEITLHTLRRTDERDVTVSLVTPPTPASESATASAGAEQEAMHKELQTLRQEIEALRAQLGATAKSDH